MAKQNNTVTIAPGKIEDVDAAEAAAIREENNAVVPAQTTAVATGVFSFGESNDPLTPTAVRLCHGMSKKEPRGLAKGSICLTLGNEQTWSCVLAKPEQPVKVVVLGISTFWRERAPYPYVAGYIRRKFNTQKEAEAAGLNCTWDKYRQTNDPADKPNCNQEVSVKCLIQKPDGVDSPFFCCVLDGKEYAPAVCDINTWSAKTVIQRLKFALLGHRDLLHLFWNLHSTYKGTTSGSDVWFLDLLVNTEDKPTAKFREDLAGLAVGDASLATEEE